MVWKSLVLGFLPIVVLGASFQDEIQPQDKIAVRVPATDDGSFYCSAIGALFSICDIGTVSQESTDAAGCLCYSSSSWAPQIFDGAVSSCADYAQTALPSNVYSLASAFEGFCTSVGDYQNSPSPAARTSASGAPATSASAARSSSAAATTSPKPTAVATTRSAVASGSASASGSVDIFTNSACSYLSFAFSFCDSASPGFSTMDASSRAPCLCYSSTKWSPDGFDGPVETCADYLSTAAPSLYPTFSAIEGFCSSVGDLANEPDSGASTTGGSGGGGIGLTGEQATVMRASRLRYLTGVSMLPESTAHEILSSLQNLPHVGY